MYNIFEKKASIWNSRLKQCLKQKGYTQTKFAEVLNNQNRQLEKSVTQETVSRWLRVGAKSGKNVIGFPNYDNMLCIAKCLEVDLGYLTGETDAETFTLENASNFLNLEPDALTSIIKLTKKTNSNIIIGHKPEKYRAILNELFTSKKFLNILNMLVDLNDSYNMCIQPDKEKMWQDLKNELGNELFNKAVEYWDISASNDIAIDLSPDELEAIYKFNDVIDKMAAIDDIINSTNEQLAFKRFKLQEGFTLLLNELYPSKD